MTDDLVKRVAKRLLGERIRVRCENDASLAKDGLWPDHHKMPSDEQYARAAIAEVLDAMGMPSPEMLASAWTGLIAEKEAQGIGKLGPGPATREVWQAMLTQFRKDNGI